MAKDDLLDNDSKEGRAAGGHLLATPVATAVAPSTITDEIAGRRPTAAGKRGAAGLAGRSPADAPRQRLIQPSVKAQTLNHCEEGPLVTVIVQGSPVKFLVDTGANVTILRSSVLESLPTTAQPALDQVNLDMSLADGRSLPFLGRLLFRVSIGGVEVAHQVWVADIEPEGILDMDFIREHGCRLTVDQDSFDLAVNYTKQELGGDECSPRCARIAVGSTTVIPPRSEALVSARLVEPCVGGEWGVTQSKPRS